MAIKMNVVKTNWRVVTDNGKRMKTYLVEAESKETAKLKVPSNETVVYVECLDGED